MFFKLDLTFLIPDLEGFIKTVVIVSVFFLMPAVAIKILAIKIGDRGILFQEKISFKGIVDVNLVFLVSGIEAEVGTD